MTLSSEDRELAFTPAHDLVKLMKLKKLSPLELVTAILRRIKEINTKIGAYITVAEEQAIQSARQAEEAISKNKHLGPLHGLPVSFKDLYNTKGIRTTRGSLLYKDFVPDVDCPIADRLKKAGAIIIGKTQAPEFGSSNTSENKVGPPARNPWDTGKTAGGSSGGAAAAVAAGLSPIADGTDGGGSIRIPASLCGVYGLKPTTIINRVPYDADPITGAIEEGATHGPISRNVRDAALMMNVISGPYPGAYNCIQTKSPDFIKELDVSLGKLKISWSRDLGVAKINSEYTSIAEKAAYAFKMLGHVVEEATPLMGNPFKVWQDVLSPWVDINVGNVYDKNPEDLMVYTRKAIEYSRKLKPTDVAKAWSEVGKWRGSMRDIFDKYDLLITPTASPAWPLGDILIPDKPDFINFDYTPFTLQFNLTGNPAATCPCGFTSQGLPVGLQIIGRVGDEVTVLRASLAFEQIRPWANKFPDIS